MRARTSHFEWKFAPVLEFFSVGGKEGNASCTVVPLGAVCGTPVQLAGGSIYPLDSLPPDLPTKTPLRR